MVSQQSLEIQRCKIYFFKLEIEIEVRIENTVISIANRVKLLDVNTDGRLDFNYHVSQICKKTSKKLHSLYRV